MKGKNLPLCQSFAQPLEEGMPLAPLPIELLKFGTRSHVMGILNVTPDSFSGDGLIGSKSDPSEVMLSVLEKVKGWIAHGVDFLDIGGESTRPGSMPVSEEEELARVVPVIAAITGRYSIPISIDTTKAAVAEAAIIAGACLINDVSGLMFDPKMCDVARAYNVPVVLMHNPVAAAIQQNEEGPKYWDSKEVVELVAHELEKLAIHAISRGLTPQQIILDPGIGFGKTTEQNLALLKHIDRIKALGYPVLVGASRKSFIGNLTNVPVEGRLPGSIVAVCLAALKGVDILRVHDVPETVQAVKILNALNGI